MSAPDTCPTGYACTVCRTPAPECTGFSDAACGAAAGEPCAPYCPGSVGDANVLAVVTVDTPAGPLCVTRCAACAADGRFPRLTADAARRLVLEHREHTADGAR